VAITDGGKVIAIGVSLLAAPVMKQYKRGVAVKVREGLRGRKETDKD
jgi:archaeosine-15-forming tRNA-guanine transglycosylase